MGHSMPFIAHQRTQKFSSEFSLRFTKRTRRSSLRLARIPAKWNHFAEKDLRQINILEQILIAKVFNPGSGPGQAFGGICSSLTAS